MAHEEPNIVETIRPIFKNPLFVFEIGENYYEEAPSTQVHNDMPFWLPFKLDPFHQITFSGPDANKLADHCIAFHKFLVIFQFVDSN